MDRAPDNPPAHRRRFTRFELIALSVSIALWVASIALPQGIAVVPEYIALHNSLLLLTALTTFTILIRQAWIRLRWWAIPISVVLLGLALLPLGFVAEDLLGQLRPAPSEGFMYRGGFGICSTHVVSTSGMRDPEARMYVLQDLCIPDGPGERRAYVRRGASPFMHEVESPPDKP
jgi:hypothetical protein